MDSQPLRFEQIPILPYRNHSSTCYIDPEQHSQNHRQPISDVRHAVALHAADYGREGEPEGGEEETFVWERQTSAEGFRVHDEAGCDSGAEDDEENEVEDVDYGA